MMQRHRLTPMGGAAVLAALPVPRLPGKSITFVVPFSPGGPTDAMACLPASEWAQEMGQSVIVAHKAGAGGHIGADVVARAAPDGCTTLCLAPRGR